jgi:hypothetical protein
LERWYNSYLNRWAQPDSIVPLASQGTQAFDRYGYVNNNPLRYNDPSGHDAGNPGRDNPDELPETKCKDEGFFNCRAQQNYERQRKYYDDCAKGGGKNCPKWGEIALFYLGSLGISTIDITTAAGMKVMGDLFIYLGAACTSDQSCLNFFNAASGINSIGSGDSPSIQFPTQSSQLGHIFSDRSGHLVDTAENRELLIETVVQEYFIKTDQYGVDWYSRLLDNGMEVWISVRNGIIQNGGINIFPRYH